MLSFVLPDGCRRWSAASLVIILKGVGQFRQNKVKATNGDTFLGGEDFDYTLLDLG